MIHRKFDDLIMGHSVGYSILANSSDIIEHYLQENPNLHNALKKYAAAKIASGRTGGWLHEHGQDHYSEFNCWVKWYIIPKYELINRIQVWEYNFSVDEALTKELFQKYFGDHKGKHFYAKWNEFGSDLNNMFKYFSSDNILGQTFLNMLMEKVTEYEWTRKVNRSFIYG